MFIWTLQVFDDELSKNPKLFDIADGSVYVTGYL